MSDHRTCRRLRIALWTGLVGAALAPGLAARADPPPAIMTYEMKKHRDEMRAERRDPKSFWLRQIVGRIEEKKPALAKPLKNMATVQIGFIVARDGHVVSKTISKSSGLPDVDRTAMAVLDRAAPFPPMPATLTDEQMSFTLPLRFH